MPISFAVARFATTTTVFPDKIFRSIFLRDACNDLALLIADQDLKFQKFFRLRHVLCLNDLCSFKFYPLEIIDRDLPICSRRFDFSSRMLGARVSASDAAAFSYCSDIFCND